MKDLILRALDLIPCEYAGKMKPCNESKTGPYWWCSHCKLKYEIKTKLKDEEQMNINLLAAEIAEKVPDLAKESLVNREQVILGVIKREIERKQNTVSDINATIKERECLFTAPKAPDYA